MCFSSGLFTGLSTTLKTIRIISQIGKLTPGLGRINTKPLGHPLEH